MYLSGTYIHVPCGSASEEVSPAAQPGVHSYGTHGSPARHTLPLGHGDDRHGLNGSRRGNL